MSPESGSAPVVDLKGKKIVEIGIVVRDAVKTAKRYADLFGLGPWEFSDLVPSDGVYRGKPIDSGACCLRCATARLGSRNMELMQPLYGPCSQRDFLDTCGEGIHHVGIGGLADPDQVVRALGRHGIGLDMSATVPGEASISFLATRDALGTRLKIQSPDHGRHNEKRKPWGHCAASTPCAVQLEGKEINQLGIVVEDIEKSVAAYWRLFGIGPWVFMDGKMGDRDGLLYGVPFADPETHIKIATAELGDMQFELLQPVSGTSSHMDFLKTRGQGIHHVSFGDLQGHDTVVEAMKREGIGIEMSGVLGNAITFTYFASQRDLGTIYEVLKINPDIECTLVPTGMYPPA